MNRILNYRGIEVSYDSAYACFDFIVAGHSFTVLQYSSIFTIIDNYLEVL